MDSISNCLLVTHNRPQAVLKTGLAHLAEAKVYASSDVVAKGIKLEVVVRWGSIC